MTTDEVFQVSASLKQFVELNLWVQNADFQPLTPHLRYKGNLAWHLATNPNSNKRECRRLSQFNHVLPKIAHFFIQMIFIGKISRLSQFYGQADSNDLSRPSLVTLAVIHYHKIPNQLPKEGSTSSLLEFTAWPWHTGLNQAVIDGGLRNCGLEKIKSQSRSGW